MSQFKITKFVTERATTVRQYIDGHEPPDPTPPPGTGWTLKCMAASSPPPLKNWPDMPMTALLFFVWERQAEAPADGPFNP